MKTPSAVHISEIGKLRSLIRRAKASVYEDSGLVFATGKGTPLDTQNSINRHFKPLLESAGLPSIRLEDLQHPCFTIVLARGTHLKYVQDIAGHASIHRALDHYSNWIDSMGGHTPDGMYAALGLRLGLTFC